MKYSLVSAALLTVAATAGAQDKPIAGLWENFAAGRGPVEEKNRKSYIFTNEALTKRTVFSGLQDRYGTLEVVCCIEVRNLFPLDLKSELLRNATNYEMIPHLESISGLKYMYQAEAGPTSQWTPPMHRVMKFESNNRFGTLVSIPLISAAMAQPALSSHNFRAGGSSVHFKLRYPRKERKVIYQFTIDGKPTRFSTKQ